MDCLAQAQRDLDPDVDDVDELGLAQRIGAVPHTLEREVGGEAPGALAHELAQGCLALARLADEVHEAQRVQLVGAAGPPVLDQRPRHALADAAAQQAVGAHAREQVEQDLGQAELRAPLGHDDVVAEHGLEAAADRIALNQGNGQDRQIHAEIVVVDAVDGAVAIGAQRLLVLGADQAGEGGEIAAHAPDSGRAGGPGEVAERHLFAGAVSEGLA
jgi:hypothetical protein